MDIENDKDFKEFKDKLLKENQPKKGEVTPPKRNKALHIARTVRSVYNLTPKQLKARARTKAGKKTRKMNRNKSK